MENLTPVIETERPVYTREAIEELSLRNNEPEWLRNKRLRSWFIYADMPWLNKAVRPNISSRFDKNELKLDELNLCGQTEPGAAWTSDLIAAAGTITTAFDRRAGLMVQNNCVTVQREYLDELKARGVIFTDIRTAVREHGDLLERRLMTDAVHLNDNKLVALHGAFWDGGAFVYIPKGVELEIPLQSFFLIDGERTAYFPHTIIIAGEGSKATFIDTHASPGLGQHSFVDGAVEIFAGEGSELRYISLQEYGKNVQHYAMKRAICCKDSSLIWCEVSLGSDVTRSNVEALLEESGSFVELLGLNFPAGEQKMEFNTLQDHIAPHCTSDLLYKGALNGNARTVFDGLIRVHPGAQKTNAYQANRNMLLSSGSRADSIPQLEIEANDVRCTHGATVGPINDDQLFYLMSRGLPKDEAIRLLVLGFFSEVIDRIPVQDVREGLLRHIEKQIS